MQNSWLFVAFFQRNEYFVLSVIIQNLFDYAQLRFKCIYTKTILISGFPTTSSIENFGLMPSKHSSVFMQLKITIFVPYIFYHQTYIHLVLERRWFQEDFRQFLRIPAIWKPITKTLRCFTAIPMISIPCKCPISPVPIYCLECIKKISLDFIKTNLNMIEIGLFLERISQQNVFHHLMMLNKI